MPPLGEPYYIEGVSGRPCWPKFSRRRESQKYLSGIVGFFRFFGVRCGPCVESRLDRARSHRRWPLNCRALFSTRADTDDRNPVRGQQDGRAFPNRRSYAAMSSGAGERATSKSCELCFTQPATLSRPGQFPAPAKRPPGRRPLRIRSANRSDGSQRLESDLEARIPALRAEDLHNGVLGLAATESPRFPHQAVGFSTRI